MSGSTEEEHDLNLRLVLQRASRYNVKFNKTKIQLKKTNVKFLGQIFSKDGITINKAYVEAIINMPIPENKTALLRFLGMVKFVGRFIPNLSKITSPLRNLTREDVQWHWNENHSTAITELKHLLTSAPILIFFNPEKAIVIETDASKDGLGTCLLQEGHPVAFASRSLTNTEKKYAQIEKETLAILFAVQKFHLFIYGLDVTVYSDHKPLETIFKKDLHSISPRLQRMRLKMLNYKLKITYKPGKQMYISDTLSRAFLNNVNLQADSDIEYSIHYITKYIPMSDERKTQFRKETANDPQLKLVIEFLNLGWPIQKHKIPDNVKVYAKLKDKIFMSDKLLFLENKIIVPTKLRPDMLKVVHEGHLGIEKTKNRARQIFYWPGQASDIESFIKSCSVCEKFARKNCKETLLQFPLPTRCWERIGTDIFTFANKSYVVLFDAFSNWLELAPIDDKSAHSVIKELKSVFARFGPPDLLVCDNVPFNSHRFITFSQDWNFELSFRSPNYPRSNGLAEKAVDISKKLIKKSLERGEDLEIALLNYRNAPLKNMGYSPSQLLNSRMTKTKMPVSSELLIPKLCEDVVTKLQGKRNANKKYFDKSARDLRPLDSENDVTIFNHINKTWEPGKIISSHDAPRSYNVRDSNGNVVRRNRVDLNPSLNPFQNTYKNEVDNEPSLCTPSTFAENHDFDNDAHAPKTVVNETLLNKPSCSRYGRIIKKPTRLDL